MANYTHQLRNWPHFVGDERALTESLINVRHRQGRLIGRMEALGFHMRAEANLQTLTEDVQKSSEIEGEFLNKEQVRSSIAHRRAWASADFYMLSDGPLFCTVQLIAVELEAIGPLRRAKAFLVLEDGNVHEATVKRIVWSEATAHLFEQAVAAGAVAGNTLLQPAGLNAWTTYNFEVEGLHTYVAGGSIARVTAGNDNFNPAAIDRLMKAAGARTVGGAYAV